MTPEFLEDLQSVVRDAVAVMRGAPAVEYVLINETSVHFPGAHDDRILDGIREARRLEHQASDIFRHVRWDSGGGNDALQESPFLLIRRDGIVLQIATRSMASSIDWDGGGSLVGEPVYQVTVSLMDVGSPTEGFIFDSRGTEASKAIVEAGYAESAIVSAFGEGDTVTLQMSGRGADGTILSVSGEDLRNILIAHNNQILIAYNKRAAAVGCDWAASLRPKGTPRPHIPRSQEFSTT